MSVAYFRGQQLGIDDLDLCLETSSGRPVNAAEISYALYDFTTGQEALLGIPRRTPVNDLVGHYYASLIIPLDANIGCYRIRWTFRELIGGAVNQVVQEFNVIDKVAPETTVFTCCEAELIRSLRYRIRDLRPDRNYHFRPPAHEETIRQFNRVFGFIWEDDELREFLSQALDMVSAAPPRTPIPNCDILARTYPEWRSLVVTGAMMHAIFALMLNWISDEFSVVGSTLVRVTLPDGQVLDLSIKELYDILHEEL
jgi:hypothetical protein